MNINRIGLLLPVLHTFAFVPRSNHFSRQGGGGGIARCWMSSSSESHNFVNVDDGGVEKHDPAMPTMIVFDLDDCLWTPEMYTLPGKPSIPIDGDLSPAEGNGVVGMKVSPRGPTVRLFSDARRVLYEIATLPKYKGIVLGAASSSEEPRYSYACLEGIEILPGLTLRQMIKYDQIGRTGQLAPDKRNHFRLLHQESGVPYEEMIYFDDCNWGNHCRTAYEEFGIVSQKTPYGLQYNEFENAIKKYRVETEKRTATS